MDNQSIIWETKPFHALSLETLYKILQLRQEVFVLEQACVYSDLDDRDQQSVHLMAWHGARLVAYTRLIPPGVTYTEASIGRVVIARDFRNRGLGNELMQRSISELYRLFGQQAITISAQQHLHHFYNRLGFAPTSEPYMDAGIPHIRMQRGPDTIK